MLTQQARQIWLSTPPGTTGVEELVLALTTVNFSHQLCFWKQQILKIETGRKHMAFHHTPVLHSERELHYFHCLLQVSNLIPNPDHMCTEREGGSCARPLHSTGPEDPSHSSTDTPWSGFSSEHRGGYWVSLQESLNGFVVTKSIEREWGIKALTDCRDASVRQKLSAKHRI